MAKKEKDVFLQLINLLVSISLVLVFSSMMILIYFSFSDSIDTSFEPSPELIENNYKSQSNDTDFDQDKVVKGIHVATGMIYDDNFSIVRGACTTCHSAKLITQNRATRDGWKQMIRWMQATQGLQDLGKYEVKILDYLAKNYAPTDVGRRKTLDLDEIDWYSLKLN